MQYFKSSIYLVLSFLLSFTSYTMAAIKIESKVEEDNSLYMSIVLLIFGLAEYLGKIFELIYIGITTSIIFVIYNITKSEDEWVADICGFFLL